MLTKLRGAAESWVYHDDPYFAANLYADFLASLATGYNEGPP